MDSKLSATVKATDILQVEITDKRDEVATLFAEIPDQQQPGFAVDAWRIGLQAIRNARAQAEEARLKDVGATLMEDLKREFGHLASAQNERVETFLNHYFDAKDGKIEQRLQAFISEDGQLVQAMKALVGPDNSALAETLAASMGHESPLIKRLDPNDADGVIQQMSAKFTEALGGHAELVAEALNPVAEGSPVQRFLDELRKKLKDHDGEREEQLRELTKALDAGDENSLINRLSRDVKDANQRLLKEINPSNEGSAMSTVQNTLEVLLKKRLDENKEILEASEKRRREFEIEVKETLSRLETQKQHAAKTTIGGNEFEDQVSNFTEGVLGTEAYIHARTGNNTGILPNCKKGDHVVTFAPGSAFNGSRLCIEAKRDSSYTVAKVLAEMAEARKNREASAGVFVMASAHAPAGFPSFGRYGRDILVKWDPEDALSNAYLHASLLAGLFIVTRAASDHDEADINAISDIEGRLHAEVKRLEKMLGYVGTIQKQASNLEKAISVGDKKLKNVMKKAREALKALNVEARELDEEEEHPITGNADDLEAADVEAPESEQPGSLGAGN